MVNDEIKNLSDEFGLNGTRPFVCECGNSGCAQSVAVTCAQYESVRAGGGVLIALIHENRELEHVVHENDTFALVELPEDSRPLRAGVNERSEVAG